MRFNILPLYILPLVDERTLVDARKKSKLLGPECVSRLFGRCFFRSLEHGEIFFFREIFFCFVVPLLVFVFSSLSFPFFFLLLFFFPTLALRSPSRYHHKTTTTTTTTGYRRSTTSTVSRPCRTSNKRTSFSTTGRRTRTTCSSTRWRSLKARCRCPSTRTR